MISRCPKRHLQLIDPQWTALARLLSHSPLNDCQWPRLYNIVALLTVSKSCRSVNGTWRAESQAAHHALHQIRPCMVEPPSSTEVLTVLHVLYLVSCGQGGQQASQFEWKVMVGRQVLPLGAFLLSCCSVGSFVVRSPYHRPVTVLGASSGNNEASAVRTLAVVGEPGSGQTTYTK